jgi:hypothetical protein
MIGAMRLQLLPKDILESDADRCPARQQVVRATERQEPSIERLREILKASRGLYCPPSERPNVQEHVSDAMLQLSDQDARALGRPLELSLGLQAINGGGEQIGEVLEEGDVVLVEVSSLPRVHLENAPGVAVAADHHVDHAPDAMLDEQLRNLEATFARYVGRDDRLAGLQCIACWRAFMGELSG